MIVNVLFVTGIDCCLTRVTAVLRPMAFTCKIGPIAERDDWRNGD
jgi:hypothetical protein